MKLRLLINRSLFSIYFGFLLLIIPFLTLFTIYINHENANKMENRPIFESIIEPQMIELKEKLAHSEMLNQEIMVKVNYLKESVDQSVNNFNKDDESAKDVHLSNSFVNLPNLLIFLPHLINKIDPLKPAFRLISSKFQPTGKVGSSIVIGVPTVKRTKHSYLIQTLRSLIQGMNQEEQEETVIVVLIAETDLEYIKKTTKEIQNEFNDSIESGLLELISPPASYYPDFNSSSLKITLGDNRDRVKWRTKQNYDLSYLMMYCQNKGIYYVQLEDDVITKSSYITQMKNYAIKTTMKKRDWFLLDFCSLGFIGKMIKSVDLPFLITFFLMFNNYKPCDWLLLEFFRTRYCRFDTTEKACHFAISQHWLMHRPALFQHIGVHSSLEGKIQKLKEKSFDKMNKFYPHYDNPPASVATSLKPYLTYTLDKAYKGSSFFWAFSPKKNDYMLFNFTSPIIIERYLLRSASVDHSLDKFDQKTTIEVKPLFKIANSSFTTTSDNWLIVSNFGNNTGIAEGSLADLGAINMFRITFHTDSANWLLVNEILIKAKLT